MLGSLFTSLENTFVQFSFRRLLYVLFLVSIAYLTFYLYDQSTGYTYYTRLHSRITALERLVVLESQSILESEELSKIYTEILNEVKSKPESALAFHLDYAPFIRFISATVFILVFVIVGIFQMLKGDPSGANTFGGALVMTFLIGVPALLIPPWAKLWIEAGAYFIVQIVIITIIYKRYGKTEAAG